jgi:hypothetical protein
VKIEGGFALVPLIGIEVTSIGCTLAIGEMIGTVESFTETYGNGTVVDKSPFYRDFGRTLRNYWADDSFLGIPRETLFELSLYSILNCYLVNDDTPRMSNKKYFLLAIR